MTKYQLNEHQLQGRQVRSTIRTRTRHNNDVYIWYHSSRLFFACRRDLTQKTRQQWQKSRSWALFPSFRSVLCPCFPDAVSVVVSVVVLFLFFSQTCACSPLLEWSVIKATRRTSLVTAIHCENNICCLVWFYTSLWTHILCISGCCSSGPLIYNICPPYCLWNSDRL